MDRFATTQSQGFGIEQRSICGNTRVLFFQVSDNPSKLKKIVETASKHFEKKEPFLILVEDDRALHFVDELLWRLPATSFLPHQRSDQECEALIVITKERKNLNRAKAAFNLSSTSLLLDPPLKIVYEFEDLSSAIKKNLSSSRFDTYKQYGFLIEAQ
ncbi:MAG: hypothetical protein A3D96_03710 [Chlamydiae bacterium RIFCSPHIGHO2_12_FULL_44_59]|nr:MAG: hypothetical protein A2796_02395 [Chlamydiae bacterium RIFCSPHIGHO2_01_FULL_44_39]OGN57120.1 MAG: hypothetical protein A3C42_01765 [Chlamydiae bacterium RIFCSPHIGHO2_02_FULL_45_9]OGN59869.1 MAG: hypothetical protein A3D96_03710 [Chlamydiae bacterium RIFCSPHIGHO2_12_FULL_44_59]OGN66076.1 MAG: hypothetical protein A2978_04225 [Chlamydiae bacterium RIFCSPLOWO2_01_FULL_44_52]OGN68612.1 MAG: hypothetical protein A3I67_02550 [Chlamydiae bacterium RIFCSPLOWO2_02_FULL_45_22]OGN69724.1 MAG: hyp